MFAIEFVSDSITSYLCERFKHIFYFSSSSFLYKFPQNMSQFTIITEEFSQISFRLPLNMIRNWSRDSCDWILLIIITSYLPQILLASPMYVQVYFAFKAVFIIIIANKIIRWWHNHNNKYISFIYGYFRSWQLGANTEKDRKIWSAV